MITIKAITIKGEVFFVWHTTGVWVYTNKEVHIIISHSGGIRNVIENWITIILLVQLSCVLPLIL